MLVRRVFADVIKNLKRRSFRLPRWNLNPITSVLVNDRRREDIDTLRTR